MYPTTIATQPKYRVRDFLSDSISLTPDIIQSTLLRSRLVVIITNHTFTPDLTHQNCLSLRQYEFYLQNVDGLILTNLLLNVLHIELDAYILSHFQPTDDHISIPPSLSRIICTHMVSIQCLQ